MWKKQLSNIQYFKKDFTESNDVDQVVVETFKDIGNAMAEIMIICGIPQCKAKATICITIKAFEFYDNKRHSFDQHPKRGIHRRDIVSKFQKQCMMTYMEALLAYTIVKRAVKAFFHGPPKFSIRSPVTEAIKILEQEFIWQHAAVRTNRLFERFEHVFNHAQYNYATRIIYVYNDLYGRLKARAQRVIMENYPFRDKVEIKGMQLQCNKKDMQEKYAKHADMKSYIKQLPTKEIVLKRYDSACSPCKMIFGLNESSPPSSHSEISEEMSEKTKNSELNLKRCGRCHYPKLFCECKIDPDTGIVAVDCSQGPFKCQWVRVEKDEKCEYHECPIDCTTSESSSESEESQHCKCFVEMESDEIEEEEEEDGGTEEE